VEGARDELVDDDAAGDLNRNVANERAAGRPADRVAQVGMTVQDQVDVVAVDHSAQFGVPQERILDDRFPAKCGARRREMGDDDLNVGVQTRQRRVKACGLSPRSHGERLAGAAGEGVRPLVRPETAAGAADAGEADPMPPVENQRRSVEDGDAGEFEGTFEGAHPEAAPVVVSEDGDDRQLGKAKELGREFDLYDPAAVRDVAGDDEDVGAVVDRPDLPHEGG
jgi:hypothetical protein